MLHAFCFASPSCGVSIGAWNLVQLRGQARVLVPRLVTGLKIWHMRQAGIFYPKHSFLTTMANLPDGAQVTRAPSPPIPSSWPLHSPPVTLGTKTRAVWVDHDFLSVCAERFIAFFNACIVGDMLAL